MVFDAAEGQLIGLETTSPLEKPVSNSGLSEAEDFLVFPVSPDEAAQDSSVSDLDINTQITHDLELFENTPVVEDVEPYNTVIATTKQSHENEPISNLSPQDILKLKEQSLEGEWNLEKWEYWFRNSEFSPAVEELAQHGLMTGEINGKSVFHIPQEYEGMLTQLQHALEDALKSQWINTQYSVQYRKMDSVTPFVMQATRKQKAFDRAVELLNQEPTIKSLIETFDAELANVQLKP